MEKRESLRWNNFLRFFSTSYLFVHLCSVHYSIATLHYVLLNISRRLSRPATNRWWRKRSALLICFMVTYEKYSVRIWMDWPVIRVRTDEQTPNIVSFYFSPARCESNIRVYLLKCLLWHCSVAPSLRIAFIFQFLCCRCRLLFSCTVRNSPVAHNTKTRKKLHFFVVGERTEKKTTKSFSKIFFAAIFFRFAEVLVLQRSLRILLLSRSTNNESSKRRKNTHTWFLLCVCAWNFAKVVMAKFTIRSLCNLQRRMLCFCCHLKWNAMHTILNVAQQNGLWNIEYGERTLVRSNEWITCSNRSATMCRWFMRTKDGIEIADETHFCFEFRQRSFFFASFSFELKAGINKKQCSKKVCRNIFMIFFLFMEWNGASFGPLDLEGEKNAMKMKECKSARKK